MDWGEYSHSVKGCENKAYGHSIEITSWRFLMAIVMVFLVAILMLILLVMFMAIQIQSRRGANTIKKQKSSCKFTIL